MRTVIPIPFHEICFSSVGIFDNVCLFLWAAVKHFRLHYDVNFLFWVCIRHSTYLLSIPVTITWLSVLSLRVWGSHSFEVFNSLLCQLPSQHTLVGNFGSYKQQIQIQFHGLGFDNLSANLMNLR
ncbi:hypothetical protein L2E82_44971 [Cichorium intybus]|uniref:Uncharacterized protein n=1 Tax=Cichorium intybus TaxID=13427 RepID=A0ACB8ZW45_CICIN|nr:hypothetical protein L2E82_44971 [Cichorium intybus]